MYADTRPGAVRYICQVTVSGNPSNSCFTGKHDGLAGYGDPKIFSEVLTFRQHVQLENGSLFLISIPQRKLFKSEAIFSNVMKEKKNPAASVNKYLMNTYP